MRTRTLAAALWLLADAVQADPMAEARALGLESVGRMKEGLFNPASDWTRSALEASQGGQAPTGMDMTHAGQAGADLRALCLSAPESRPECEAFGLVNTQGIYEAARNAPPEPAQALRSGQLPLTEALAETRVGIQGHYSGCGQVTRTLGRQFFDEQYCHDYYLRVLDQPCTKTLDVEVTWHYACPAGSTGPIQTDPHWSGGDPVPHHCDYQNTYWERYCDEGYYESWNNIVGYHCRSHANYDDWRYVQWRSETFTDTFPADQWATERDVWTNPCAGYDARVPPGLLPPDGITPDGDTIPYPQATGAGPIDKCERTASQCVQPRASKWINNHRVTRDCWAYEAKYTCLNLDPRSDCNQPRWGNCTKLATACVDWDLFIPNTCTATQTRFSCMIEDTTRTETSTDCSGQVYQDALGRAWDTGHEADTDLIQVAAFMEAGRQAGAYLDPNSLEIFKGYDSRCKKKLFGLVNCCNKGGSGSGSLFSNSAIAAATAAGKAGVSTYVYDALFVSDAPNLVINGFSSLFGSGTSSALAGVLAGEVTVQSFLTSLVPGPWTLAMMALQFSGLMDCQDRDIETALRRDARLCVDLGAYCSKKVPLIGTCLERTYSHCCFNSRLAMAINTQGKSALGRTLGSARNPSCGGFSVAELQQLDLSSMDLSEFMDDIQPQGVSPQATSCYFQGETSCPPVR